MIHLSISLRKSLSPSQLQQIIDKKLPDNKVSVINMGIPGLNSSQLLNRIESIREQRGLPAEQIELNKMNPPENQEDSREDMN